MNMPQQPIINWKPGLTYFVPLILCSIAAFFICYIPVLQTLSGDIYTEFLLNRVLSSILSGIVYPLFFTGLTFLIIDVVYRRRGIAGIPFSLWALAPFGLLIAVSASLDIGFFSSSSVSSPQTEDRPYSIIFYDPVIEALALQSSPAYFFGSASIGIILLLCFRPFRTGFRYLALAYLHHESFYHKIEEPEAETPVLLIRQNAQAENGSDEQLIEQAKRLVNTFAAPRVSDDTVPSGGIDIVSFVYGEGFDYAILESGHAIPFIFDDETTIEDLYEGAFLHINTTLYIRFDHIMFINMEELQIGISSQLSATFSDINRNRVKEKIQSYRDTEDAINCFHIHPDLLVKLQQAINRFTG